MSEVSEQTSEKKELQDRVEAKRKQLEGRLAEVKADSRSDAREEVKKIRAKLDSLQETLERGWDDLSNAVAAKLNDWLKKD